MHRRGQKLARKICQFFGCGGQDLLLNPPRGTHNNRFREEHLDYLNMKSILSPAEDDYLLRDSTLGFGKNG